MKKLIAVLMMILLLTAFACAEEDGQNPVMNLIGIYEDETSQRAWMQIMTDGDKGGVVEIHWASSAFETTIWTFSGVFDTEDNTLPYENCVKTDYIYDEDGNETAEVLYENGTGRLTVNEDWSILWTDDVEDTGAECVFVFSGMPELAE